MVLITIDTLRADHLGCYGYPRNTSPTIDALAQNATVFTQCVSQSTGTLPSHSSIFCSLNPPSHGAVHNLSALSPEVPSLVRLFRDNGYRTGAVVSSAVVHSGSGLNQGFQDYNDSLDSTELNRNNAERRADSTTGAAIEWIWKRNGERFFLWIHYIDPHGAYYPPEQYRQLFVDDKYYSEEGELPIGETHFQPNVIPLYQALPASREPANYISQYDAEIRFVDEHINRLLQFMKKTDLMANTIIVVTSDHGEILTGRDFYFSHSIRTYDELALIPLIVYFPNAPAHRRIDEQVRAIDILPTIMDRLKIKNPHPIHGRSLMPLVRGDAEFEPKPAIVFSEYGSPKLDEKVGAQRTIRTETWKFTQNAPDGSEELYNLVDDPAEKTNLADRETEVLNSMKEMLEKWEKSITTRKVAKPELSRKMIEQLESLGYTAK